MDGSQYEITKAKSDYRGERKATHSGGVRLLQEEMEKGECDFYGEGLASTGSRPDPCPTGINLEKWEVCTPEALDAVLENPGTEQKKESLLTTCFCNH